jgi:hypothetical protein
MSYELTEKEDNLCRQFALNFAQQQGWYDGMEVSEIDENTNDGYGYSVFEQGLNIAQVALKFFRPHLTMIPIAFCRGVNSQICEYDTKLMREQQAVEDSARAQELKLERLYIRRLLSALGVNECLASSADADCFRREEQPLESAAADDFNSSAS